MKKGKISYSILITILVLLSVCLFSCSEIKTTALSVKYEQVSLPLNASLNIENYIEYEGKGKFSYAIENTDVLSLQGTKVTAIGIGVGSVIINYGTLNARFSVIVTDTSAVNVTAQDCEYMYDGELKNITVNGTLPENSTIKYLLNGEEFFGTEEIGSYEIEIEVTLPDKFNLNYVKKTANLTITKGVYSMRNIAFASAAYTYDGTEKNVLISGKLPEGVSVSYLNNKATNAGVYIAKAIFNYDSVHYEPIDEMTARLTINRKDFVLGTNGFTNTVTTYNGLGHKVELTGLPNGLSASYFLVEGGVDTLVPPEGIINSGTYTIKVTFETQIDSIFYLNYNQVQPRSITFVINKASFASENLAWKAMPTQGFIYNGTKVTVGTGETFDVGLCGSMPKGLNGEFPEGVSVAYKYLDKVDGLIKDATKANFVDAGKYSIFATFTMPKNYGKNYLPLEDMPFTIIINKAVYDMSGVVFLPIDSENKSYENAQVFDENSHIFAVNASAKFFNDVAVKYYLTINNGTRTLLEASEVSLYSVGSYKIDAEFELKVNKINYDLIIAKRINVVITKLYIPLNNVVFVGRELTYDKMQHSLVAENLPVNVSVTYTNNDKTNAGNYNVLALPTYKNIDIANYAFTLGGNIVSSLTAVLRINKAILTALDVPENKYSTSGGTYSHTKTLADYPIIGKESNEIWWVTPTTVPTVVVPTYKVGYNPDLDNYVTYEYRLPLTLQKAVIDGSTMVFESQFVPFTGNKAVPIFTINGNSSALKLDYNCATDLINIGKHDISSITVSLLDTDNYEFINSPTIVNKYICIYSSSIFSYTGLQLTKYNGANANVVVMDGTLLIKSSAFENNSYIRNIVVPSSVTSIGAKAFFGVPNLNEITLPFVGKTAGSSEKLGSVFGGTDNTILSPNLTKVNISNSNTIFDSAFSKASYLEEINYLTEVTTIYGYAFSECSNLIKVQTGDNIQNIGESIFYKCFNISEIKLPFIGSNISDIRTITYLLGSNSGTNLYSYYTCKKLELTSLSLTILPSSFLAGFSSLNTVILPSSITKIGSESFSGVFAPILLNNNFTSLTAGIFKGYKGNTITIPTTVTAINESAFYGAVNLTVINLPKNVTSIGENAFYDVKAVINFDAQTNISTIGDKAFANYKGSTIMLPQTVSTLGNNVFLNSEITSIGLSANIINMGNNIFKNSTKLATATIGTTYIANNMFENCTKLYNITIDNAESIGANAFKGCIALSSISLSAKIVSIEEGAFSACFSLGTVIIYSDNPPTLGLNAFEKGFPIRIYIKNNVNKTPFENKFITFYGYNNMTIYNL